MPGVTSDADVYVAMLNNHYGGLQNWYSENFIYHIPGFMTGREVMQFVGTEIFRKMYSEVWVDATICNINNDNPTMAIITDVRFPNEVKGIQNRDGKVIRMTRNIHTDEHESEKALDGYVGFDCIVPEDVTIDEQNKIVETYLNNITWLPRPISECHPG